MVSASSKGQVPMADCYSVATLECHAADTKNGISLRHILQKQSRPVGFLLNVRQAGLSNYLFLSVMTEEWLPIDQPLSGLSNHSVIAVVRPSVEDG